MQQGGVLTHEELVALVGTGAVSVPAHAECVQMNSIDLPLGARCHRLRGIRAPRPGESVAEVIEDLAIDTLDLATPHILERNAVYLAELDAHVNLPQGITGVCDSKSSTGRVDVQTRLLADGVSTYDTIPQGYTGPLYLFISSNSFLVRVRRGVCLNQVRFVTGDAVIDDEALRALAGRDALVYREGKPVAAGDLVVRDGIYLHLDLTGPVAGYRARHVNEVLDLTRTDNPGARFWEPIPGGREEIILERNEFYILTTAEAIRVPATHCAWLPPFRPEFGEFRSHYAGFCDSGFGYGTGELDGANVTLEVRSQDNSLTLLHGTPVAPLLLLRNTRATSALYGVHAKSNYQGQRGARLAKYFA